jgi:hypothetical protein
LRVVKLADTLSLMARPVATIQQDIRDLTDAEKEEILAMLIAELDGPPDEGVEASWLEEVERRSLEIDRGTVACIPATDVFARVAKVLGK